MDYNNFRKQYCQMCGSQRCPADNETIDTCGHNENSNEAETLKVDYDKFKTKFKQEAIQQTDMCWVALKAQLNTHNPNKKEVDKLGNAMVTFIKNLMIVNC